MEAKDVVDLFIRNGYVTEEQGEQFMHETATGKEIHTVFKEAGIIEDKDQIFGVLATEIGAEFMELGRFIPDEDLLKLVPADLAQTKGVFPVRSDDTAVYVAMIDPMNAQTLDDLRFAMRKDVVPIVADTTKILRLLDEYYASNTEDMADILSDIAKEAAGGNADDEGDANSAPIVRFVDLVLYQAVKEGASDIHFEPFEESFNIRYRVDGNLIAMAPPPAHLAQTVTSRIKVISNLNIAEKRLPQDGRLTTSIGGKTIDMRVSTLPTIHGESVVLRVLDQSSVNLDLEVLGLPDEIKQFVDDVIQRPNGIFIVTGPTGAGKTTTMYACLRKINTIEDKLLTVEDPVEYDVDGIIQVPVNDAIGVNFGRVLRAFLRQDPDRIMVGEMRDGETVQIAVQASLTGHLVLSTLHTNDAAGAVTRLTDMGSEPFLLAATMEGVLAQRLLRRICADCRTPYEPTDEILAQLKLKREDVGDKKFFTGAGCDECGNSGYKGRKGIFELLKISEAMRELITERAPTTVVQQRAVELGMVTIRQDGLRNIYTGDTSIEEVLKYT
ncbi:MAG: type IV pilus assembly protein PilB [Verrucomicrobiales bacterium]|jgi:type IV pilus assembly protein PilB